MKKFNKGSVMYVIGILIAIILIALVGFAAWKFGSLKNVMPVASSQSAAVALAFSTAGNFAVLAGSGITNTGPTTITGDVGTYSTLTENGFGSVTLVGTNHVGDSVTQGAKTDLTTAYNNAAGQASTSPIVADLGGQTLTPGVYNSASSINIGMVGGLTLTLDAQGDPNAIFIFQAGSTLTTQSGSVINLINGAQPCNVFWQVGSSATLGTNSTFRGNILALSSITVTTGASVQGRVLAQNGAVTLDSNTITVPACASSGGGFTYIPRIVPLIGILKVPNPLVLSSGPGLVTYNYTVWNIGGLQPLTDITVTDDKCSPVMLISGDTNNNKKIDWGEKWKYSCSTTLPQTTTNTAIATGHSDDSFHTATIATAIATVAVGTALPPPIIGLVKVPSRLTPFPVGGGNVTYTYTVTNPGTVPIHDVVLTDDKCSPITYTSSDADSNNLLDAGESWVYTCNADITTSTTNIATVKGTGNGYPAVDYAHATVLVDIAATSTPSFPSTGFAPKGK